MRFRSGTTAMIVTVTALGLVLFRPAPAAAQFGVQGGFSMTTFDFGEGTAGQTRTPYLTGGLFYVFSPDVVTGQIDVLYTVKGAKSSTGAEAESKITYVEFPLAVRVQLMRRPTSHLGIFAGTTIGVRMAAKAILNGVEEDFSDEVDQFDFGITFGVGFQAGRLVGHVRYTHGIRDIEVGFSPSRTRTTAAMVGVRF